MLAPQVPRRLARPAIVWSCQTNDVCIFCCSVSAPNDFRRTYAKYQAPRAPSTRTEMWRNKPRVATAQEKRAWSNPNLAGGKLLPPLALIEYLKKAGLIKADPAVVLRLLDAIRELGSRIDGSVAKKLCIDHGVALDDMPYVARACLYSGNPPTVQKLGKTVLLSMSANQVPEATLHLLRAAVKQDEGFRGSRKAYDSSELGFARHHLRKLIADKHPDAMAFQAKRLADAGKRKEAIAMLRDAIASGLGRESQPDPDDADNMHKQYSGVFLKDHHAAKKESPWTLLAQLERAEGNFEGAKEAFQSGATIDDDPMAFEGLSGTVPEFSRSWLEYMTKAAASGSWTAMARLGRFYSVPLDRIPEEEGMRAEMEQVEKRGQPIEWWYYYLSDKELAASDIAPGTRLIGADFWGSYKDPSTHSTLKMVRLNSRHALAMEWYEIAWRAQFIFSDRTDTAINESMQEIVENAAREDALRTEPKFTSLSMERHRRMHFATRGRLFWERAMVDVNELRRKLSKHLGRS